jgi:hypothetical protein
MIPQKLADRAIPRSLIEELDLFPGQLYISSFVEYIRVYSFLGRAWKQTDEGEKRATDGFILRDKRWARRERIEVHEEFRGAFSGPIYPYPPELRGC